MKVYQYEKCESCRKAIRWLNENGIKHTTLPIREKTPTKKEFSQMIKYHEGELKKLFNTSSKDYRDPSIKNILPQFSPDQAMELLIKRGNLNKRPVLIGNGLALQGFKPEEWEKSIVE